MIKIVVAGQLIIEIRGEIGDIKKKLADVEKEIEKTAKSSKKTSSSVDELKQSFGKLNIVMSAARGLFAGVAVTMLYNVVNSITRAQETMQTFELVIGKTANTLMTDLRTAASYTVSDIDLMQASMRALALGIREEDLPGLMEVARARAKVMGIETTQAFNDMVIGIGRQSRMILDNLGIIIDADEVYTQYAKTLGKTKEQLTKMEQTTAISSYIQKQNQALVAVSTRLNETYADSLRRLQAEIKNTGTSFSQDLISELDRLKEQEIWLSTGLKIDPEVRESIQTTAQEILNLDRKYQSVAQTIRSAEQALTDFSTSQIMLIGEPEQKRAMHKAKRRTLELESGKSQTETILQEGFGITSREDWARSLNRGQIVPPSTIKEVNLLLDKLDDYKTAIEDARKTERDLLIDYQFNTESVKAGIELEAEITRATNEKKILSIGEVNKLMTDNLQLLTDSKNELKETGDEIDRQLEKFEKLSGRELKPIVIPIIYRIIGRPPWLPQALQEDLNVRV